MFSLFKHKSICNETDHNEAIQHLKDELIVAQKRIECLEANRTDLYNRIDAIIKSYDNRFVILEDNRTDLYHRIDDSMDILRRTGLTNVYSKIDYRIARLEVLKYYSVDENYKKLDDEQKRIVDYLMTDYEYGRDEGRLFSEDPYYDKLKASTDSRREIFREGDAYYTNIGDRRLFLGENEKDSRDYLEETEYWLEGDTPHRYLDKDYDGIDILEDAILLDIGAAEGYFGVKHYDKCKKVYFFEYDQRWLQYLRRTCETLDRAEIVEGFVGDTDGTIRLDDFFKGRSEKPNIIKMDVEGAEGSVLRGMGDLLYDDNPLTLLICTYHRQEDWDRYYEMLKGKYRISHSKGYYWNLQDPHPPFFRRGIMRAEKIIG